MKKIITLVLATTSILAFAPVASANDDVSDEPVVQMRSSWG